MKALLIIYDVYFVSILCVKVYIDLITGHNKEFPI